MSKKGAPTAINEAKPATVPLDQMELGKAYHVRANVKAGEEPKFEAIPVIAAEPKAPPTLTADQRIHILTLQRNAVLAEGNKLRTDAAFEKAYAELNKAYAAVNNVQGFALDQLSLEFVATS